MSSSQGSSGEVEVSRTPSSASDPEARHEDLVAVREMLRVVGLDLDHASCGGSAL